MNSALAYSRHLDLRALASLQHLQFAPRGLIEGAYSGRHPSRQRGGAGVFVDYREYAEGEDLRHVDWKVLARTGRAYSKLFQDETNLRATLVIDASRSMWFGARSSNDANGSKLEYAQRLAAALSYLITLRQDQVGLAVVGDGLKACISPGATSEHLGVLHAALDDVKVEPARHFNGALRKLFERSTRRGVLILLSDFLAEDSEALFHDLRLFRHRQWEVMALHLVHPGEERLPEGVAYRFEGLEGDGVVTCSPFDLRQAYAERFAGHLEVVRSLALATGCDYRRVSTGVSYLHVLRELLIERS